ncbi:MAG: cupin domain-containing protein [Candidatus Hatepunaea meridiana]|nr:cupin domain-containing protein [Candidatus Hatepunaea meridiana]
MEPEEKVKVVKFEELKFSPTKREGVTAAKMIRSADSSSQNIVIVELDANASIEDRETSRSESIYILQGAVDVIYEGKKELLLSGDLVYFPAGSSHELIPRRSPCKLLLIFSG